MSIYFIKNDDTVKIGYSKTPEIRINTLNTASPKNLEIILVIKGEREDEAFYHHKLKKYRIKGEWFKYDPELISFINRLKKTDLVEPFSIIDRKQSKLIFEEETEEITRTVTRKRVYVHLPCPVCGSAYTYTKTKSSELVCRKCGSYSPLSDNVTL